MKKQIPVFLLCFVTVWCWILFVGQRDHARQLETTAFIEGGVAAKDKPQDETTAEARKFFVDWLEDHHETDIVDDDSGVGVAISPTRLFAFRYGDKETSQEVEFRIVLPDGREIQEFVGAMFTDKGDDPTSMALVNFCMSTLHPVYSCFMNQGDVHMQHETMVIGGDKFTFTSGDMLAFGNGELPEFNSVSKEIKGILTTSGMRLPDQAHWLKVVYGRDGSEMVVCSVTIDNESNALLTERVSNLQWPDAEGFYMAKEFVVLRPGELKSK